MDFYNTSNTYNVGDEGFMFAANLANNDFGPNTIELYFSVFNSENFQGNLTYINAEICTGEHFPSSVVQDLIESGVLGLYL